jgi:anti-anti-sigma factor
MEANGQEGQAATGGMSVDAKNLTIQGEWKGGVLVAQTAGRVDGSNAREFQEALETLLSDNVTALLLDLEQLSYISSAGLRVILLVSRQLQSRDGKLGVCSLSEPISEVFSISGFDKIISTHTAQADALAAFKT